MTRKILALAIVSIFALALAGCQTESGYYDTGRSAGAGALVAWPTGAALGAIIGEATGAPATGAWVGAAAGGLLGGVGGYLYAEHRNSEIQSQQAAAQSYNYQPSQGNVVSVDRRRQPFGGEPRTTGQPGYDLYHPDAVQYSGFGHPGGGSVL